MKVMITKAILWFLAGLGATVLVMRLIHGPGSVTALTDIIPWGLWKGGGVVALVPIGAAGFAVAMFAYVFGWRRYQPVVRGAVLLALMCYSSVGLGLTVDIGIWWRIVFPVFHWQIHSVLFEVAWCIMLYLAVLAFEFSHAALERFGWQKALAAAHKLTILFVIAGISLSTLHQSSLGTLFLATPFRLHPLWYTDLLPLQFFVSAIGVGCLTITVVAVFVHWLYDVPAPASSLSGLARIAAWVLAAYALLKVGEVLLSGEAALLVEPSWDVLSFWLELLLSAALPAALLSLRRLRESTKALFWIGLCATLGLALNRVNVAGLATLSLTHADYVPAWTEWAVTGGILATAGLFYLFAVENLRVFPALDAATARAAAARWSRPADALALFLRSQRFAAVRLYSFAFVAAAALSFGCLSRDAVFGVAPLASPVTPPRVVGAAGLGALMLDGNRDGDYVLFDHERHVRRGELSALAGGCESCHHMRKPHERATGCSACHRDMLMPVDIFDHDRHEVALAAEGGCATCHADGEVKDRAHSMACTRCHRDMRALASRVAPPPDAGIGPAAAYKEAVHGLCIDCHAQAKRIGSAPPQSDTCAFCHRAWPLLERPMPGAAL